MIILSEGPDCSGKTTYAQWLVNNHGYDMVHYGSFDHNPLSHYIELFNSLDSHDNVVIDRCWPSEIVYGQVLRGSHRIGNGQFRMLQRAFIQLRGCMVLMSTPKSIISTRLSNTERHEMDGVRDNWEDLVETYKNYTPGVPYVRYAGVPFSAPPSPELLSEEVNNFYSGGIRGRRDAEILIISKSMHSNSGLEYPYCSTMPFAIWFNDMLSRCGIPELNIAWATERDIRRSDIMELDPSIILTLSKQGDSWYRSQDLEDYPHAYMTFTPPELWYQHQWNPTNRSPVYPLAAELKHLWSQV